MQERKRDSGPTVACKSPGGSPQSHGAISFFQTELTVGRRQQTALAMEAFRQASTTYIEAAVVAAREKYWAEALPVPIALELYVLDKMEACFKSLSGSTDVQRYSDFERVANTAASPSRKSYLKQAAIAAFEDLAPDLNRLCASCGVATLANTDQVIAEYLPMAQVQIKGSIC